MLQFEKNYNQILGILPSIPYDIVWAMGRGQPAKIRKKQTNSADFECILFRAEQVGAILGQDTLCFGLRWPYPDGLGN